MRRNSIQLLLFILIISLALQGCSDGTGKNQDSRKGITLTGQVNSPVAGLFYIETYAGNSFVPYDTIYLKENNSFEQFIEVEKPGFYRINFTGRQFVNVILNQDDLHIVADGNAPAGYVEIKGSTELDQLMEYNNFLQTEFLTRESELNNRYVQARQAGKTEEAVAVQEEYMALMKEKEQSIIERIRSMGPSLAVIQALNSVNLDENYEFAKQISDLLLSEFPNEPNVVSLAGRVERMSRLAIGQPAPEIALPNPDGEVVSLSSLRGNVVLVDFWAEWCKPCRMENPNVVRAYDRFNKHGFEVYGVSLDRTREKWLKGINEDGLRWTHVSDLRYWQSAAAKSYNVSAIPMSFLLDQNGTIIAKNLRGKALHEKLEALFLEE